MDYPSSSSLQRLVSGLVLSSLALGPSSGCKDSPIIVDEGSESSPASSGPSMTSASSADTTAGSMSESGVPTTETSSSSGDPGSTGTTQGVSASGDSSGTTEMTSGTTEMTSGTTDMTSGTTDMTSGTTDATSGTTDMTGGTTDGDTDETIEVPDFSGDFLMAVATPIDPSLPFQYIATFDYLAGGMGGGGTVDVELQPLALDTNSTTTPRTFFGPPLVFPGIVVTPDGTFAIAVGVLDIAAETNPLFFTDAQANNVVFSLQVLDADDLCGTVSGMLVFPVAASLEGTTTASIRVLDVSPAALPVAFPAACP